MDFLNPSVLGPLFRFNREFYDLDDRGRPTGYRNLDLLHTRIAPVMLRRRKADVETELPERIDRNHFVPLSDLQKQTYAAHEQQVMRLATLAQRRPLTQQEQEKLQRELAMMRMICDTNYILDPDDRTCPKLGELEKLLEECRENGAKVIIFSEWERMLELVRELCDDRYQSYRVAPVEGNPGTGKYFYQSARRRLENSGRPRGGRLRQRPLKRPKEPNLLNKGQRRSRPVRGTGVRGRAN